jgi:hypothetical protein
MSISIDQTPTLAQIIALLIAELESATTAAAALGILDVYRERLLNL